MIYRSLQLKGNPWEDSPLLLISGSQCQIPKFLQKYTKNLNVSMVDQMEPEELKQKLYKIIYNFIQELMQNVHNYIQFLKKLSFASNADSTMQIFL